MKHSIQYKNVGFSFKVSDNFEHREDFLQFVARDRGKMILPERVPILEH